MFEHLQIDELKKRFGTDEFFQLRKRIPYGSEMAPRNVPLYDERGELVEDSGSIVERVL